MIRFLNVYFPTRTIVLMVCETFIVFGSFLLASALLLGPNMYTTLTDQHGGLKIAVLTVATILCAYYFDLYEPQHISAPWEINFRLLVVIGSLSLLLSAVIFLFPEAGIARYVLFLGLALVVTLLIMWRRAFEWISGKSIFQERVFVLGDGEMASSVVDMIRSRKEAGMEVVAWEQHRTDTAEGRTCFATAVKEIPSLQPPVSRIVIALQERRGGLPVDSLLSLRFTGIMVEEVSSFLERLTGKVQLDTLRPSNLLFSEGFGTRPSRQLAQRLTSIIVASIGLLIFLPFFPLVVLAVRLSSPGPIFFSQTRVGLGGKLFRVYKFRTMFTNAESGGAKWATKGDSRVTRVGSLLRKTRIDEVPQLWNVLRGDMSFVGPRPERPEFVPMLAEQIPYYDLRHMIRPGLTGWAQVRYGYGATLEESREKLAYDLYYLKNKSFGLDLLIMFETIKTIVRRRGAQ